MLEIERLELAGIPCLTLRDGLVEEGPVIIHYHGWTGDKGSVESPDASLAQLASAGFFVVAPDCHEHGERRSDAWYRAQFNGWAFICEAMDKTREEAGALYEAVMALPGASRVNAQVSGASMGGLVAQMVFAENREFSSLVSVVGRSSFYQADGWCREAQAGAWPDAWCGEYATQSHPERFVDRPVLFIDGGLDSDCPPGVNAETVRRVNALGGRAEHFVDLDCGHGFSPLMRRVFVDWLARHGGRERREIWRGK